MSKDDHPQQPSAPDLGAVLHETPEYTMVGSDGGDLLDAGYVPPDRPYVLNDDQVTARGMREGETLDQRLVQERPDVSSVDAKSPDAESDRAGRLEADDYAPDTWSAESLDAVDVGISGGAATAEEAAVHVLPADEMGEAPDNLAEELDDEDLPDDALGVDDRAPENLEQRPEEDVRVGRTSTGADLSAAAHPRPANAGDT
ncbi:MAG: DUF5709 domain-containing protein [Pseudonocardiaceae bacterium]